MQKIFNCYSDPGHGWVKVKRIDLVRLGLMKKISNCSYERKGHVYLEEDCDWPIFSEQLKKMTGISPKVNVFNTDRESKIRNYRYFELDLIDESAIKVIGAK